MVGATDVLPGVAYRCTVSRAPAQAGRRVVIATLRGKKVGGFKLVPQQTTLVTAGNMQGGLQVPIVEYIAWCEWPAPSAIADGYDPLDPQLVQVGDTFTDLDAVPTPQDYAIIQAMCWPGHHIEISVSRERRNARAR